MRGTQRESEREREREREVGEKGEDGSESGAKQAVRVKSTMEDILSSEKKSWSGWVGVGCGERHRHTLGLLCALYVLLKPQSHTSMTHFLQ